MKHDFRTILPESDLGFDLPGDNMSEYDAGPDGIKLIGGTFRYTLIGAPTESVKQAYLDRLTEIALENLRWDTDD